MKEDCPVDIKSVSRRDKNGAIKVDEIKLKAYLSFANRWVRDFEYFCSFPSRDDDDGELNNESNSNNPIDRNQKDGMLFGKGKNGSLKLSSMKRLRNLEDIENKLNELKGKKSKTIHEVHYKKNLKTRLTKQKKRQRKKLEMAEKIKKKKLDEVRSDNVSNNNSSMKSDKNVEKATDDESSFQSKDIKLAVNGINLNGFVGNKKINKTESVNMGKQVKIKSEENDNLDIDRAGDSCKISEEKVVFNKDAKMVFNKIDFSGIGKNKRKKFNKLEKDPKHLLEELKAKKVKIAELSKSGENNKAKSLREKDVWMSALKKAEGIKVKDDPELLKKTMRKQKQLKNRHKKKWENRVQVVEKKKEEFQKKRQENIAAKKKEKKKKKIKRSIKKGRIVI